MSTLAAAWLAWSLAGLSVAISVARIALYVLAESTSHHVQGGRSDDCFKAKRGYSFHALIIRGG
jgi:hypothetical protein